MVDVKEKAELAASLKNRGGYNCCQAVTAALANETDLSPEALMKLSAGFAAGMGTMQNTCGALVGAAMVAGLKTNGAGTVRLTSAMSKRFSELSGSVICRELKGIGTGRVLCPCDQCVRNAVCAYYEIIYNAK